MSGAVNSTITTLTANNAVISYTIGQGAVERTGTITMSRAGGTVSYTEDYTETAATDIEFTMNANVTTANLNYSSTTAANLFYRISTF